MMTDPVADMATRIRNGVSMEAAYVEMPASNLKAQIAGVLVREGFIWEYETHQDEGSVAATLRISLKYGPAGERVVRRIRRVSKPGRRVYFGRNDMPRVLNGMGILVLSTNQGVLSNREAVARGIGGEALLEIW